MHIITTIKARIMITHPITGKPTMAAKLGVTPWVEATVDCRSVVD